MIVHFTTQAYRSSNRNIQQSNSNPKQNPRYIHFWQIADSLDMFQMHESSSLLACIGLLLSMHGCQGKHIRCCRVCMLELLGPREGYPIPSMVGGKDHQILRHGSNSICPCILLRQRWCCYPFCHKEHHHHGKLSLEHIQFHLIKGCKMGRYSNCDSCEIANPFSAYQYLSCEIQIIAIDQNCKGCQKLE